MWTSSSGSVSNPNPAAAYQRLTLLSSSDILSLKVCLAPPTRDPKHELLLRTTWPSSHMFPVLMCLYESHQTSKHGCRRFQSDHWTRNSQRLFAFRNQNLREDVRRAKAETVEAAMPRDYHWRHVDGFSIYGRLRNLHVLPFSVPENEITAGVWIYASYLSRGGTRTASALFVVCFLASF